MRQRSFVDDSAELVVSRNRTDYAGTCSPYDPWKISNQIVYNSTIYDYKISGSMEDVVIENFRKRSANGEIFNNPFESITTILANHQGNYYNALIRVYNDCGGLPRYTGTRTSGPIAGSAVCTVGGAIYYCPQPSIDIEQIKSLAITDAFANADASKAAALATLGEARETVSSIVSIFKRLFKILRALRRLDLKSLSGEISPKELRDRYMELRYAIRPLFFDAKQVLEAATFIKPGQKTRQTFRGKRVESAETLETAIPAMVSGYNRTTLSSKAVRTVSARAGVLTNIDVTPINLWGIDQPIEAIWELIPFSFIIDWFFNVGKTIAAWTPNAGVTQLASWCVVEDTTHWQTWVDNSWLEPGHPYNYEAQFQVSGLVEKTYIHKYREVNPNRAIFPRFSLKLDSLKLLDLGIILKSLLRLR